MGLLDDLKRQADMARTHDSLQRSLREENVRAVDEAMHRTFLYLLELFKQLAILKPVNPTVYSLAGIGELKSLGYADAFVDARKTRLAEREVYDYIDFWLKWSTPGNLVVERDMPLTIAKVRDMLWAYNIKFTEEEKRNEQRSLLKVIFTIPKTLVVDFTLKADHENRKLLFYGKNALRLGMDDFAVPADEMTEPVIEELAKVLICQPSEFTRKYRTVLKRSA
jgi:hypothetical protein